MTDYTVVFVTTGSIEEARQIARVLVETRLAACVNIIPQVESIYWWDDAVQTDLETKMVIKTRRELCASLITKVKSLHSYDVCEVTCVPVVDGNPDYLAWVKASTGSRACWK